MQSNERKEGGRVRERFAVGIHAIPGEEDACLPRIACAIDCLPHAGCLSVCLGCMQGLRERERGMAVAEGGRVRDWTGCAAAVKPLVRGIKGCLAW